MYQNATDTYYYSHNAGFCQAFFAYFFIVFSLISFFPHFGQFPRSDSTVFGDFVTPSKENTVPLQKLPRKVLRFLVKYDILEDK